MAHRVFIVEDDEAARDGVSLLATSLGWSARGFSSPVDCLAAMESERPQCIIADLNTPRLDGAEFMTILKARGVPVPVIVTTGFEPDAPLVRRVIAAGARAVLYKPYADEDLVAALTRALPP